jgi:hypothetical protein
MIKIVEGMKLKVVKGEQNHYGKGKHSAFGEWIAGSVPVGTVGTVYMAKIGTENFMFALDFEGITPKEGYCFGLSEEYSGDGLEVVPD